MKWLFLGMIFYLLYKSAGPVFSIFKMNEKIKDKKRKTDIHSKVRKLDIQDAEFEEESDD